MIQNFDKLDRRILFELDQNARQSVSQLAKKLRQGRDRVDYRLQRLKDERVFLGSAAIIDSYQLGRTITKTYLRLAATEKERNKTVKYLRSLPYVFWVAETDGRWDLMFSIFARDLKEFYDKQETVLDKLRAVIIDFNVYPLVDFFFFSRSYLYGSSRSHVRLGGHTGQHEIDDIDAQVLRLLAADARIPIARIAEELDISPTVVTYRIQKLEEQGIIKGYRADFDLAKVGVVFFKSQIFLRTHRLSFTEELFAFADKHPHITYLVNQIGDCKLELELEVVDYYQYREIIDEIRNAFPDDVRNIESSMIRREFFNWSPTLIT